MNDLLKPHIKQLNKQRSQRRKAISLICVLSLIVAIAVFWQLRFVGITMTDEACCGKTEHTHTEECVAGRVLVCPLEETAVFLCGYQEGQEIHVHTHDDNCYKQEIVYTCGLEESETHTHNENCISIQKVLICTLPETEIHHHSEACLPPGGHIHTDQCYETVYSCGYQEHHHTLECYTDLSADVEDAAVWSSTLPQLTGDYATDLVNVANSQLYYSESTRNVEFDQFEDGTYSERGYTRYGAWAGHPYIDNWSAVFASFCLNYSQIPQSYAPWNSGCNTMMQEWNNVGKYKAANEHFPAVGDLVFTDKDDNGSADGIGIITRSDGINFTAVEGNLNERVEEKNYTIYDSEILGYGVLRDNQMSEDSGSEVPYDPSYDSGDYVPYDSSYDSGGEVPYDPSYDSGVGVPYNPSDETWASSWMAGRRSANNMLFSAGAKDMLLGAGSSGAKGGLRGGGIPDQPLDIYITSVTGTGTVQDGNDFLTLLELSFSISANDIYSVLMNGQHYVYSLPDGILLTDALVNNSPYYAYKANSNPLELAFTYYFVDDGDGTYSIRIDFDPAFVQAAVAGGSTVVSSLRFRCCIDGECQDEHGQIHIVFTDACSLDIPPEEISHEYDISAQKTGSYVVGNKLRYEVTVSSINGTPDVINLTDTFTYTGDGTITAPQSVSVTKYLENGTTEPVSATASFTPGGSQNVYNMSMTLPQLGNNESYTIVYEYEVTGLSGEDNAIAAYNRVDVESHDNNNSTSDFAEYSIYKQKKKKLLKWGTVVEDYIQWVLSVNEVGSDIAGKTVTDEQFANAVNEEILGTTGIYVTKDGWSTVAQLGTDYTYVYDAENHIIGLQFLPADGSTPNTSTYYIVYYTLPDVAYNETTVVTNDANFDGEESTGTIGVEGGGFDKTADGYTPLEGDVYTTTWTVSVKIPSGGIASGTVFTDTFTPAGDHYLTAVQWNTLQANLQTAWGSGNITDITPTYDPNDGTKITGYSFRTAGSAGDYLMADGSLNTISWTYSATAEMDGAAVRTFTNTFSDGEKELSVDIKVSPGVKKLNVQTNSWGNPFFSETTKSMQLNYEDPDKTFVWIVEVKPKAGILEYHITDTLPDGVELLGIKVRDGLSPYNYEYNNQPEYNAIIAPNGTISGDVPGWGNQTHINGTYSGQTVDLTLTPTNGTASTILQNTFYIVYYCQLKEEIWPTNGTVHLTLNNSVSVEAGNEEYGQAENTIVIDATRMVDVVEKSGAWNKDTHLITYTIYVNPEAENLLISPDGTLDPDTLTLVDILTYRAKGGTGTGTVTLNLNSVVLEKEVNGVWQPVPNVSWNAYTETDAVDPDLKNAYIEMEVPDSAHLRLTYSYYVFSSMPNGIQLNNRITLEGHADDSWGDDTQIGEDDFSTSGESNYSEFQLIKVDKNSGAPLQGAVFTAYVWNGGAWQPTGKTYTTDNEGEITVTSNDTLDGTETKVYTVNTAYCICETSAPEHYILPENPQKYYFWFSDNQTAPNTMPDDFMLSAADISTTSQRIEVDNEREQGYTLPETGGPGTVLYTAGGVLLMTSVILLLYIYKKRRKEDFATS